MVLFVVLAGGLIAGGMWYADKISAESESQSIAQGVAAEKAQSQIMQNFKMTDEVIGTGAEAKKGDTVTVNYVGTLDDGTKFDSSYDRKQAFTFPLGAGQVIQGWDLGVVGMKVSTSPNSTSKGTTWLQASSRNSTAADSLPANSRGGRIVKCAGMWGSVGCSS